MTFTNASNQYGQGAIMQLTISDALTRGELQFAIVETFNADTEPDGITYRHMPYFGDGSRDMTGTVRLMDGAILPFAYVDGRFPIRESAALIRFDEEGYSPAWGGRGMSWPFQGNPLMVEVEHGRVRRWTWPGAVLGDAYGINAYGYLVPPAYSAEVRFPGLHCLIDMTRLSLGQAEELVLRPEHDFPAPAVYVGHYADDYLAKATMPYAFAVLTWDRVLGKSKLVSFVAKM